MVDHDVVTNWVDDLIVIEEEDVVGDVLLQSRNELRPKRDDWLAISANRTTLEFLFISTGRRSKGCG